MFLKHSAIYSSAMIINGLLGFAAIAVYTRLLGSEGYGHYALAFSTAAAMIVLTFEWLRLSVLRFGETENGPRLLSINLSLYLMGGLLAVVLAALLFIGRIDTHFPAIGWLAIGAFIICGAGAELFLSLARAALRPSLFASMQLIRGILALGFGATGAFMGYGFAGVLGGVALASLCTILFGLWRNPAWLKLRPEKPDPHSFNTLLAFGLPIVVNSFAAQILLVLDRYAISHFHGSSAVGEYAAAGDLAQKILLILAWGINLASYNITLRSYEKEGQGAAEARHGQTLAVLMAVIVPAACGLIMLAGPLCHVILAPQIADAAARLLPFLVIVAVLQILRSYVLEQPYMFLKDTKGLFRPLILAGITALGLWFFLVPGMGAVGAAIGLIAAHGVGAFFSWRGIRRRFKTVILWRNLGIIMGAAGAMCGVLALVPDVSGVVHLAIKTIIGGVVYVSVCFAGNVLDCRTILLRRLAAR